MTDKAIPILFYSFLFCVQVLIIRGDLEMKVSSCPVARWSATGLKDGTEANYNPGGGGVLPRETHAARAAPLA